MRKEEEKKSEKMRKEEEKESEKMRNENEKEKQKMQIEKEKEIELEKLKEEAKLKEKTELEKLKLAHELELAKLQLQNQSKGESASSVNSENSNSKRKFTLPKLEFRQFGDDLKDWLPFWSQFEHIHKDDEIASENKFQYLIQATIVGSRAREVVESFPPTGANYAKAVDSLKARFGKEDLLVEVYVRELLKLIISAQSKEKISLTSLYDKLESYMRALETLGVTTDKCASILYPMVESCFPVDFLKAWNRSNTSTETDAKDRLQNLMNFLRAEVEGEERISLALTGFGLAEKEYDKNFKRKKQQTEGAKYKPSAAVLLTTSSKQDYKKTCVFCNAKHLSSECFKARKMSLIEKQNILKENRCCFACLFPGHTIKQCKAVIRCFLCDKKHATVICQMIDNQNKVKEKKEEVSSSENEVNLSNINRNPKVFLQTLKANIISDNKEKTVRLLLDSGSQKSYILKKLAEEMKFEPLRREKVIHSLFGGVTTRECDHNYYKIKVGNLNGNYRCNFEVLDQITICDNVLPVCKGSWIKELGEKGIVLTDVETTSHSIQILIGADIMGKLLTGRKEVLSSGLVAIETFLGWTLMGKFPQDNPSKENLALSVTSMFIKEAEIADLWRLDLIGINDPIERLSKAEVDRQTKEHFLRTVQCNKDGRYEICLPWIEDKAPLPDNLNLARKRLNYVTTKLLAENLYQRYDQVLLEWLDNKIIEDVPEHEVNSYGHYLPHRPVIKESSSTTPIRPVFDASAKTQNNPSLNQCLHSGPNLIELIPDVLLRFREKKFGVIADIKKAFLQISIAKADRDFLRFLWWDNVEEKKLRVFRHTRVVFGVKSSPFLLASVIEHHIKNNESFDIDFRCQLLRSFYVDNVVTSVHSEKDLEKFIGDSKSIMSKGGFDLRGWEYTRDTNKSNEEESIVLGLIWNRRLDVLKVNLSWLKDIDLDNITKRTMLSVAHKLFDPIGYTSPVTLCPKLMLQKSWKIGVNWDEEVPHNLKKEFLQWFHELSALEEIRIPRFVQITVDNLKDCTVHTFCDASKDAYAAVVFLRLEQEDRIQLFLLAAKSRVAPLRGVTIPRMELLAALIGSRLAKSVIDALHWEDVEKYFWSDSTTVLTWISKEENWSVFVRNRVQEIRKLSNPSLWKYIPSEMNPADLPSRGSKAKQFVTLRWWEGPTWLKDTVEYTKYMSMANNEINREEIENEKLKSTKSFINIEEIYDKNWYYKFFSSYEKIVRLVAWILRFKNNCHSPMKRIYGELSSCEFQEAERHIVWMIQNETLSSEKDERLKTLETYKDENDIIRVKTKILYRKDNEDFLKPVVLPSSHEVVKRLISYFHVKNSHAGVQIILNLLREKYWILNGRKTVSSVISKCTVCKRYNAKHLETSNVPLPENRVKDATVFQITGIDMAGPIFLKGNHKSWVILFTCAVYRAVHLELVTSASTDAFLMAFRRFVSRRGRCSVIYCDNGSNFVGAANYMKKLNWSRIQKYGAVNSIKWHFNPPTAPWWGGWWERLIRLMKDLLKRVLGQACLTYEEMLTVLVDCERVINSRPLTYMTEQESIKPISPSMFLLDIQQCNLPDVDTIEEGSLNKRIKYRQAIQKDLKKRFRAEYLGQLVQRVKNQQKQYTISTGDIVLVGTDNKRRINWPLGRIVELIPGKDGKVRLVKIQTATTQMLRPIQRIFPLEVSNPSNFCKLMPNKEFRADESTVNTPDFKRSRYGRILKIPDRLQL